MMMPSKKIDPRPRELPDLMNSIKNGSIRIPGFQRDFVWEASRIQILLDSMCKEYPIGTILLWKAPSEYNHLLRNVNVFGQPPIDPNERYQFLLDGQQRLTSLYATINGLSVNGEDLSKIVIDLEIDVNNEDEKRIESVFCYRTADNQRYVSVRDLLSTNHLEFYDNLPSKIHKRRFDTYMRTLQNYPFSVVSVSDMKIDDAIEIFERINRQGRRLDRYDLVAVSLYSPQFDLRKRTTKDIQNVIKDSFGEIPQDIIPQALALNTKGNSEAATQMSLDPAEVESKWSETVGSILAAITLFKDHFGIVNESFLPYDALLPVMAYYFFQQQSNDISSKHLEHIERWFWNVTFSERYSGTTQSRMSEDAAWLRTMLQDDTPYSHSITADIQSLIETKIASTTSAVRNGVLCALKLQRPLSLLNGVEIDISKQNFPLLTIPDQYRIFPIRFTGKSQYIYSISNFWFIPPSVKAKLDLGQAPSEYMSQIRDSFSNPFDFERIMYSHLIPIGEDSGIWTDDYHLFLEQRARLILARIYQLSGIEQTITDSDPVVNAIEFGLRDVIDTELKNKHGIGYWPSHIPSDVVTDISKQMQGDSKRSVQDHSVLLNDPRQFFDYASPRHYWEIIEENLDSKNIFGGQESALWERHLKDFQEYRNVTKHNRKADTLLSAKGLGACIWLSRVLKLDLSKYGVF